jgi:hypothetical protein
MHCSKNFLVLVGLFCGGCSTHPLPEDVTPLNTYQIVQKIRCEVRDSLRSFVIGALKRSDPIVAADLKSGKRSFDSDFSKQLTQDGSATLQRYEKSALAYEFVFDMTENNTAGGNIGVASILSRGPLTFTASAGAAKTRRNKRNFRIVDSFGRLVRTLPDRICENIEKGENAAYPITGTIGMSEVIKTFLDLNQSGNLSGAQIPTLAETLEFTTRLDVAAGGGVKLEALGRKTRVSDAALSASAFREDKHNLTITVSLPMPGEKDRPATIFEKRAFDELERQRILEIDDEEIRARRALINLAD